MKNKSKDLSLTTRNSSIELLKIVGIVLIIISHVTQTLTDPNDYIPYQGYIVNTALATTNVQYLILSMLRYCGYWGNIIFFISSAWFLLDSPRPKKQKILQMMMDVWAVSVIICFAVFVLRNGNIDKRMFVTQFFPTTFANNWYFTCYIIFYSIHGYLNMIIKNVKQSTLLQITLVMLFLYVGLNFIIHSSYNFFVSDLVLWVVIYFAIAYMKLYLTDISNSVKINLCLFAVGFIGNFGLVVITNYLGLRIHFFSDKLFYWKMNCSPFLIMMSIGLFNIARNIHFNNKVINYVSKLSLLIYIIHENKLLKIYYRPMLWEYVYENMGYEHILFWAFVMVFVIFVFALILSMLYNQTIQKLSVKLTNLLYPKLRKVYRNIERMLLKLH